MLQASSADASYLVLGLGRLGLQPEYACVRSSDDEESPVTSARSGVPRLRKILQIASALTLVCKIVYLFVIFPITHSLLLLLKYFTPAQEMGSATPLGVEQLAACGGRGAYKGNVWRDLRSGARASETAIWLQ